MTLILADEGFRALGVERKTAKTDKQKQPAKKTGTAPKSAAATTLRVGSKQSAMIALLQRANLADNRVGVSRNQHRPEACLLANKLFDAASGEALT